MNTELPMRVKIIRPVKRCSLIPRNLGCSPGAEHSDSSFRLLTWVMERTVAATNHGRPITEQMPSITPTMKRSKWYPQPFWEGEEEEEEAEGCSHLQLISHMVLLVVDGTFSLCSFLLMMTAVICWSMKMRMVHSRAGISVTTAVHHGFGPSGLMNQPRSSLVGWYKMSLKSWGWRSFLYHLWSGPLLTLNTLGTFNLGEGIPRA